MVASQNGWRANDRSVQQSWELPGGSVTLHQGSAGEVLCYVGRRFHAEVQALEWPGIWGYAERNVRGSSDVSNHASGTALDLNAPLHPLGTDPTRNYTIGQIGTIHQILNDCEGLIRWGGDYDGRKDGMHFEVNDGVTEEQLDALWAKLSGQSVNPGPLPVVNPNPPQIVQSGPAPSEQVRQDQFNLNDTGFNCGTPDGIWGPQSAGACQAFQHAARISEDGICGDQTRAMLKKVPSWHGGEDGGYSAKQWQQKLKDHGWRIAVDNVWGSHSASILKQFQADKGIAADGVRGPESWTCLYCTVN